MTAWCTERDAVLVTSQTAADLLALSFEGIERTELAPSDITAGLALIRIVQKEAEEEFTQQLLREELAASTYVRDCVFSMPWQFARRRPFPVFEEMYSFICSTSSKTSSEL